MSYSYFEKLCVWADYVNPSMVLENVSVIQPLFCDCLVVFTNVEDGSNIVMTPHMAAAYVQDCTSGKNAWIRTKLEAFTEDNPVVYGGGEYAAIKCEGWNDFLILLLDTVEMPRHWNANDGVWMLLSDKPTTPNQIDRKSATLDNLVGKNVCLYLQGVRLGWPECFVGKLEVTDDGGEYRLAGRVSVVHFLLDEVEKIEDGIIYARDSTATRS